MFSIDLKTFLILIFYFLLTDFNCSIILDADATSVVQRVALRTDDIPLGEQTVAQVSWIIVIYCQRCITVFEILFNLQVLQSAKEQLKWSLLK